MEGPVMFQGMVKDSLAFRLMTQMGWEEGSGLGKGKQGIKSYIRVKKRNDASGIGVDEQKKAAANWSVNTHVFDNILKNLKVQVAEPDEMKVSEPEGEDSGDDEDVEALKVQKVARPQGRYKRREGGKLVQGYSETDLNAILGGQGNGKESSPPDAAPVQAAKVVVEERQVETAVTSTKNNKITKKKTKLKINTIQEEFTAMVDKGDDQGVIEQQTRITSRVDEVSILEMECLAPGPAAEVAADWWGTKYGFVRGGQLGSKLQEVRQTINGEAPVENGVRTTENGRTQFSEQDQENLYKLVNDKATTGKKGLGQGDRPLKVGGAKFEGQKKVFDDNDDSDDDEAANEQGISDNQREDSKATEKEEEKPKKRRKREETSDKEAPLQAGSKIKLKDLVAQILMETADRRMSLRKLQKRIMAITGLDQGDGLRDKLLKSSRFVVEGKKVLLAAMKSRTK